MPINLPEKLIIDYLLSRSVMDPPRSLQQSITDFLFGRTYPEQVTNTFTGGIGTFSPVGRATAPIMSRMAAKEGLSSQIPSGFQNLIDFDLFRKWPELGAFTLDNSITNSRGGEFLWDDIFKPRMSVNPSPDAAAILNYILGNKVIYGGK